MALFTWSKANENGHELRDLTRFHVPKYSVLENITDELGDENVEEKLQTVVLCKETAAADEGGYAVEEIDGFFYKRRLIRDLQEEYRLLVCKRSAVLPGSKLHTSIFGEASPVCF